MTALTVLPAIALAAFGVLWISALNDLFRRSSRDFPIFGAGSLGKTVWFAIILLGSGVGALFYYFLVMKPYPRRRI